MDCVVWGSGDSGVVCDVVVVVVLVMVVMVVVVYLQKKGTT